MSKAAAKKKSSHHVNTGASDLDVQAARCVPYFEKLVLGESPNLLKHFDWNAIRKTFEPLFREHLRLMELNPRKKR